MTRIRALIGALATGSLALSAAGTVSAQNTIAITGTTSAADPTCLGLLALVPPNYDCSFGPGAIGFPTPPNKSGPIAGAATCKARLPVRR